MTIIPAALLVLKLLAAPAGPTTSTVRPSVPLYIDEIDDGWARVLQGEQDFCIPVELLPPDATVGTWVNGALRRFPSPQEVGAAIREEQARKRAANSHL